MNFNGTQNSLLFPASPKDSLVDDRSIAPKNSSQKTNNDLSTDRANQKQFADLLSDDNKTQAPAKIQTPARNVTNNTNTSSVPAKPEQVTAPNVPSIPRKDVPLSPNTRLMASQLSAGEPVMEKAPILALLTGNLKQLSPAQIPGVVLDASIITQAIGSDDIQAFMETPVSAAVLLQQFDFPQDIVPMLEKAGVDLNEKISPNQLLKALGFDVLSIGNEIANLKQNLPLDGLKPYMERAAAMHRGTPKKDMKTAPAAATPEAPLPNPILAGAAQLPQQPQASQLAGALNQQGVPATNAAVPATSPAQGIPAQQIFNMDQSGRVVPEQSQFAPAPSTTLPNMTAQANTPHVNTAATAQPQRDGIWVKELIQTAADPFVQMGQELAAMDTKQLNMNAMATDTSVALPDFNGLNAAQPTLAKPELNDIGIDDQPADNLLTTVDAASRNADVSTALSKLTDTLAAKAENAAPTMTPAQWTEGVTQPTEKVMREVRDDKTPAQPAATPMTDIFAHLARQEFTPPAKMPTSATPVKTDLFAFDAISITPTAIAPAESKDEQSSNNSSQDQNLDMKAELPQVNTNPLHNASTVHKAQFATHIAEPAALTETASPLAQKVFERASMLVNDGGGSIRIDLGNSELGKIDLAVNVRGDQLDLRIITSSEKAREILLQDIPRLRDNLQQQNLQLKNVDIGFQQSFAGQQQGGQRQQANSNFEQRPAATTQAAVSRVGQTLVQRPRAYAPNLRSSFAHGQGQIQVLV